MATTACPNCGSPLRAGARFCGSCGHVLGAPVKPATPAPPPPSDVPCPHCGKPVRQGARFCSACGQSIEPAAAGISAEDLAAAQQETRRVAASVTVPSPAASGPQPIPPAPTTKSSGVHAATKAPAARAPAAPMRRRWVGAAALLAVAVCLGAGAGGYVLANQMGWLGGETPLAALPATATLPSPSATQPELPPTLASPTQTVMVGAPPPSTSAATFAAPLIPTLSDLAATLTAFVPPELATALAPAIETPVPSASPAPTATLEPTASALALSPAPTQTGPAARPSASVLIDDPFDNGLRLYWRTWGDPRPQVDSGPGDYWLYLKAIDAPFNGGVTTRSNFPIQNAPGAEITFQAQLLQNYPTTLLMFDWDPQNTARGPEIHDPGLVHIEIVPKQIRWRLPLTKETCQADLDGQQMHTFLLRFLDGQGAALYIDGSAAPVCMSQFMGLAPVDGSISFTGAGWVTRVTITQPGVP